MMPAGIAHACCNVGFGVRSYSCCFLLRVQAIPFTVLPFHAYVFYADARGGSASSEHMAMNQHELSSSAFFGHGHTSHSAGHS